MQDRLNHSVVIISDEGSTGPARANGGTPWRDTGRGAPTNAIVLVRGPSGTGGSVAEPATGSSRSTTSPRGANDCSPRPATCVMHIPAHGSRIALPPVRRWVRGTSRPRVRGTPNTRSLRQSAKRSSGSRPRRWRTVQESPSSGGQLVVARYFLPPPIEVVVESTVGGSRSRLRLLQAPVTVPAFRF